MNEKQAFISATPEERLEAMIHLLRAIETRESKQIIVGTQLITERRGPFPGAHFINDRRTQRSAWVGAFHRWSFISILLTVSTATMLISTHLPTQYAAPLITFYITGITAIFFINPIKRLAHSESVTP